MHPVARRSFPAVLLLAAPLLATLAAAGSAAAAGTRWACTAVAQQSCRPGEDCASATPWLGELELYGGLDGYRVSYCLAANAEACFQGILEQDYEGWPDWGTLGVATVERLPLKRSYHGEHGFYASFDVNARTLLVVTLSVQGQTTVWFDCIPEGT